MFSFLKRSQLPIPYKIPSQQEIDSFMESLSAPFAKFLKESDIKMTGYRKVLLAACIRNNIVQQDNEPTEDFIRRIECSIRDELKNKLSNS